MRVIKFEADLIDVLENNKHFKADVEYVIPRELIRYYSDACDGLLSAKPYKIERAFDPNRDWNGKRILIHRVGSAGDLLFITPLLREMKERWPECHLDVYCQERYHWVFANNPHIDRSITAPMLRDNVDRYDAQVDLESISEFDPRSKTEVLTDLYASIAGIKLLDNRTIYKPSVNIVDVVARRFPKTVKRVGICVMSDSPLRDYPYKLCLEVIAALMKNNIQVVLLGKFKTGVKRQPLFIDLAGEVPVLSWEQSVAFMKTCDLVLGPDSSAIHFAGAMGIPSLGLFGPFLAKLRIPPQPATQAIQATGPCAPCFHHGRGNTPYPPNGPCKISGSCEVLASIPPQQVVDKILEMIGHAA